MNTNASTNARPSADDDAKTPDAKAGKIDLSLSQTLGGALAAMTAAALGSRLGVAGTIVGAALASIIAGVAGTLYTASLRASREKVKTVWSGRVAGTDTKASVDLVEEPPVWDDAQTATREIPRVTAAVAPAASSAPRPRRSLPWKGMLAGAVAAFAVAVVALTGFELLSGSALSGERGTTIQQVTKPQQPAADPTDDSTPSKSPTSEESETPTPTPTPTATETPTASETPAPPVTEAPTTQQPTAPSESPSEQSEPTSSPTPSVSATPSASAEATPGG